MPETTNKSYEPNLDSVQFPLIVFFELTALIALISLFSPLIGWLAVTALSAMALSILMRQGSMALGCFGLALVAVKVDLGGVFICVGIGLLIASWPMIHAAIFARSR